MLKKILTRVLDLLYPPRCVICHAIMDSSDAPVCSRCMDSLPEHDGAQPQVRFASGCYAAFFYEGNFRTSFHRYKFGGQRQYADTYGKWLSITIRDYLTGQYDLISWAPVSAKRLKERGYDQSRLLAERAAGELRADCLPLLKKVRDNPAQSGLHDASQRAANVTGVYEAINVPFFAGKRVLLIDDIVTTGATLSECSRVLLTAGAKSVVCAALATPRNEK